MRDAVRDAKRVGLPLTVQSLNDLVERTLTMVPSDTRLIVSYKVLANPDGGLMLLVATSS